jgi:hypothetical protein
MYRSLIALGFAVGVTSCVLIPPAPFRAGSWPNKVDRSRLPRDLVGEWVNATLSSPLDTVVWEFRRDGENNIARVTVKQGRKGPAVTRRSHQYGWWEATVAESPNDVPEICFVVRARNTDRQCASYLLDTLLTPGARPQRRLRLLQWEGVKEPVNFVLYERMRE